MADLAQVFSEARAFREQAERARKLAGTTSSRLQGELYQSASLYDKLADGKDSESTTRHVAFPRPPHRLKQLAHFENAAWPD
jgi:hypothetical protein